MDAAHLPVMALLAVITFHAPVVKNVTGCRRRLFTAVWISVFAAAVEIIQPYFGRTESVIDFLNGVFGMMVGLGFDALRVYSRECGNRAVVVRIIFITVAGVGFAHGFRPAMDELRGMVWRRWHFPILAEFGSIDELPAWHGVGGGEVQWVRGKELFEGRALKVGLSHGGLPGAEFLLGEQNWRGSKALEFEAYNPGQPFPLVLRVDDDGPHASPGDRAHWTGLMASGTNHVCVLLEKLQRSPKGRLLNLSAIRRLVFFTEVPQPGEPRVLYLGEIQLTH